MSFNFNNPGGDKKPSPFSFGNTATPAANANQNIFGQQSSTTPAGNPPASTLSFGSGSSLFGQKENTSSTGTAKPAFGFGTATPQPATQFAFGSTTPAQPPATGLSFGAAKTEKPSVSFEAKPASGFSFGKTDAPASGGFSFGKPAEKPGVTLGGKETSGFNFGKQETPATKPEEKKEGFSFGKPEEKKEGFSFGKPEEKKENAPSFGKPEEKKEGFSFGKPEEKKEGGFSFGKPEEKKEGFSFAKPEEKKEGFSFGKPEEKKEGGFSFGKPEDKTTGSTKPEEKKDATGFSFGKTEEKKDGSTLGTKSTAPAPNSLKNKTMEDVINKWSADLDKYSQDFQKQARQISTWDQSLLTSGDQISRLYAATVEAEQSSGKIDQALNYIENQQDELSQLLESYESQVRDITTDAGLNQPADQERESAYQQAEALIRDLEAMGKNIAQLTEELNTSTSSLTRLKDDDPLTSIVKILNAQVQTLTWIDENTTKLNEKVNHLQQLQTDASPRTPTKHKFGSLRLS